jgi:hypothetical protein
MTPSDATTAPWITVCIVFITASVTTTRTTGRSSPSDRDAARIAMAVNPNRPPAWAVPAAVTVGQTTTVTAIHIDSHISRT